MDKVSVVIPFYNMENNVKRVITSLKKQSYKNFEVILVNDGSKDKTEEAIKKCIKDDKRFRYFYKKNGGVSSARNFGLKKCKGKYVCFVDSDDYVEKDFIKLLYNSLIDENSDISACYFNRIYNNFISVNSYSKTFSDLIKYPAPWNKMYKMSLFKENNIEFYEGKWYEDLGMSAKLMMMSNKISIVNKPLYNYIFVSGSSSIMHTYDERIFQMYDIVEDIEKFAKKNKIYEENYNNIEFIHIYHILVGTIYRSSFMKDFSSSTIENIIKYVDDKYENWYKNDSIKNLDFIYKIYLFFIKHKMYKFLYITLKLFNKKINL